MFPLYLQYLLTDFRQTFVTGVSRDTDDLITFLGQKVKVQGHTIAAEAHSTRRYRRVQLFLVTYFSTPIGDVHVPVVVNLAVVTFRKSCGYLPSAKHVNQLKFFKS